MFEPLESRFYSRDPAEIMEREESDRLKVRHGCKVCVWRAKGIRVYGEALCRGGNVPKHGLKYCEQWKLDEETIG